MSSKHIYDVISAFLILSVVMFFFFYTFTLLSSQPAHSIPAKTIAIYAITSIVFSFIVTICSPLFNDPIKSDVSTREQE